MDWLLGSNSDDVERQSMIPSDRFFKSNDLLEEEAKTDAREEMRGGDVIVISDSDADGLGVVLSVRQAHDDVRFVACGPHNGDIDLDEVFEMLPEEAAENPTVYLGDICPDSVRNLSNLEGLVEYAESVTWWDHHEWEDDVEAFVEDAITTLHVDADAPERCAAEISRDDLVEQGVSFPDHIYEAIEVTGIYDLWKKVEDEDGNETTEFTDERARDLNDLSYVVDSYDEYFETVEEYGADVMDSEDARNEIYDNRVEKESYKALALSRADFETIEGVEVATTYGRGPTNDIADDLREQGADLVVIVKPSGGMSLRGSEGFEDCHIIAREYSGGGHERAAGGFLPPRNDGNRGRNDTDIMDYAEHWLSEGRENRDDILDTVREHL